MSRDVGYRRRHDPARWRARRGAATALRLLVLLAPVAVSVAASFAVTRLAPAPAHLGARVLWLAVVVVVCGLLAWPARRQLRRLLPLAALLELSILFPGEAPARWRVAREAGSIRHLELLAAGVPDSEPVQAATTILALVASLARHDRVTRGHSDRVRVFTDMIGEEMRLPSADRDRLRWAALIHDVGKLEVSPKLLRKPGKPTPSEWESLRLHPEVGARLTAPLAGWLGEYAAVVVEHHERFDGSGYPVGLRGEQITLGARIVGLADAFEVMTAARPYKKASSRAAALREVVRCSGTHFDPAIVRAFLAVSTPRLRRALGPASWVGQLPVVGTAPAGGLPAVAGTMARGAGTIVLGGMATAVVAGSVASASPATDLPGARQSESHPAAAAGAPPVYPGTQAAGRTAPGDVPGAPGTTPSGVVPGSARPTDAVPNAAGSDRSADAGLPAADSPARATPPARLPSLSLPSLSPQPAAGAVGATVNQVTSGLDSTVNQVTDGVSGTVTGLTGTLGNAAGGSVGSTLNDVGTTVGTVVDGVGDVVTGLLGGGAGATPSASATSAPAPSASAAPPPSGLGGLLGKLLGGS